VGYSRLKTPEFDSTAISDSGTVQKKAIVNKNMDKLRGGIDGFFDTFLKVENGELSKDFGEESMEKMLVQIEESRQVLAGLGVALPNQRVNFETTTVDERMHELGNWVYSHYEEFYPWRRRLQSQD
jgi:hypothetical protein